MDEKELQDLQMFGIGIDNTGDKKEEKSDGHSLKTIQKKQDKNLFLTEKVKLSEKKLKKNLIVFGKWFFKKIKNFYNLLRFWKFKRKLSHQGKKFDHDKIFYKIVETHKKRFNKVVITRRRVPYYYINNSFFSESKPRSSIYFLSLKEDEKGGTFIKKTSHKRLEESVWDFPAGKVKKSFWEKMF